MATTIHQNDFLTFEHDPEHNAVIVTATQSAIPGQAFQQAFDEALENLDKAPGANKMVFDKRNLGAFDQRAMVWYHVDWKPRAYDKGIVQHVKLLPDNQVFRQSVELGKNMIKREHPEFNYDKYNISYAESMEDALKREPQAV